MQIPMLKGAMLRAAMRRAIFAGHGQRKPRVWPALCLTAISCLPAATAMQLTGSGSASGSVAPVAEGPQAGKDAAAVETAAQRAENEFRYDDAEKLIDAALQIRSERDGPMSPEYGRALARKAEFLFERDQLEASAALYQQALERVGDGPEAAGALLRLGIIQFTTGDDEEALWLFQKAGQASPAVLGAALTWMGMTQMRQRRQDEAEALFRKAFSLEAEQPEDLRWTGRFLAALLRSQGRMEEAGGIEGQIPTAPAPAARSRSSEDVASWRGRIMDPARPRKIKEPEYTRAAKAVKLEGTVTLSIEIDANGKVRSVELLRGLGLGLDQKAVDAVRQWEFTPALLRDGTAVASAAGVEMNFRLP